MTQRLDPWRNLITPNDGKMGAWADRWTQSTYGFHCFECGEPCDAHDVIDTIGEAICPLCIEAQLEGATSQ